MIFIEVENYQQLSEKAADIISKQICDKPNSVLGLATGSSPIGIYRCLVERYQKGELDMSRVTTVNLDEYLGLSAEHIQSYRYFMNTNLFNHINIDKANTFVPDGLTEDVEAECRKYDENIDRLGGIDLQLLGIGLNGHIGFNEPDDRFVAQTRVIDLHSSTIEANARFFDSLENVPRRAITMGMGGIMKAKKVLLIANGEAKRDILMKAMKGAISPQVPASLLQLHPDLTVVFSPK